MRCLKKHLQCNLKKRNRIIHKIPKSKVIQDLFSITRHFIFNNKITKRNIEYNG